ncbi:hypothetical protein H0H93_009769 [Arthromyces matolae]|nr:hypothetical protein H0H93_009769 [Arthromyces matolae]
MTHTFFYDRNGESFATIEWTPLPYVSIRGILSKQRISEWLKLPLHERHMTMEVYGVVYTWVPSGTSIRLFATHSTTPQLLAFIDQESDGGVNLMITEDGVNANLLEVCIVVTVLLLSGRDFAT